MKLILNDKEIDILECESFKDKLFGLMFKKDFSYGICLNNCRSIHTMFMRKNIDIIMTDKQYRVLYIYNNLAKNRIVFPKRNVYYTFELPSNLNTYSINDILILKK